MAIKERRVPLLPRPGGALQVALLVADASSAEPFVRSGRQTTRSRRYLAVVESAAGAVIDECVLLLPTEDTGEATGAMLDRQWQDYHEQLLRVRIGGGEGQFPELVLPGEGDELLPPMVYCPVPGRFFELPCPSCFGPLQTCRDDEFLARCQLPLYSVSNVRLLFCPDCSSRISRPTVVDPRSSTTLVATGALVLNAREYLLDLATGLGTNELVEDAPDLFCGECAERQQCWQWQELGDATFEMRGLEVVGSAAEGPRWRVLSTHGVPYLVLRPSMVPLDRLIRSIASESARPEAREQGSSGNKMLFAFDGSGMDALEILTLRLTAFCQAVTAVRDYHRLFGGVHLDISSESLTGAFGEPAPGLPDLWNFRVRLEVTSAADLSQLSDGVAVAIPSDEPLAPFFSPVVRDFLLTGSRVGELHVDRLLPEAGVQGLWRIEGKLIDPRGVFPRPTVEDWIRLQWSEDPTGLGVSDTVAKVDPRGTQEAGKGFVKLTTEPLSLNPDAVLRVERLGGVAFQNVSYRVFPEFGAREDLFSLGMVFFMCLLVNDGQDLTSVADDLGLVDLNSSRSGLRDLAKDIVARHPDAWGPHAVFFDAADRGGGRPNAIPHELWLEAVTLGFRLLDVASDLLTEEESGAGLFQRVESETLTLLGKLRSLLFDRQKLNAEIQSTIAALVAEAPSERIR